MKFLQNARLVLLLEHDYVITGFCRSIRTTWSTSSRVYYGYREKEYEDNFEPEECIIDDEDGKVDFSYKRKTI